MEIVAGLTDALTRARSAHTPNVWAPLGPDLPYFRLRFTDGSWLGLRFLESEDAAGRALDACRGFS
ncbi:hypothetical protein ACFYOY_33230 [Streptomyces sp. NPDC007875]|uniref:hypothetical protein n=1 Tax=Streptomyces sp. NPDC007875 TaxID=3364783 RepID=UPI00367F2876